MNNKKILCFLWIVAVSCKTGDGRSPKDLRSKKDLTSEEKNIESACSNLFTEIKLSQFPPPDPVDFSKLKVSDVKYKESITKKNYKVPFLVFDAKGKTGRIDWQVCDLEKKNCLPSSGRYYSSVPQETIIPVVSFKNLWGKKVVVKVKACKDSYCSKSFAKKIRLPRRKSIPKYDDAAEKIFQINDASRRTVNQFYQASTVFAGSAARKNKSSEKILKSVALNVNSRSPDSLVNFMDFFYFQMSPPESQSLSLTGEENNCLQVIEEENASKGAVASKKDNAYKKPEKKVTTAAKKADKEEKTETTTDPNEEDKESFIVTVCNTDGECGSRPMNDTEKEHASGKDVGVLLLSLGALSAITALAIHLWGPAEAVSMPLYFVLRTGSYSPGGGFFTSMVKGMGSLLIGDMVGQWWLRKKLEKIRKDTVAQIDEDMKTKLPAEKQAWESYKLKGSEISKEEFKQMIKDSDPQKGSIKDIYIENMKKQYQGQKFDEKYNNNYQKWRNGLRNRWGVAAAVFAGVGGAVYASSQELTGNLSSNYQETAKALGNQLFKLHVERENQSFILQNL